MHPAAIIHATKRLDRARQALHLLKTAKDPAVVETAWEIFLMAASGFYSKLEQGSKANGKSSAWFGRKKHERKNDELLSYIHHARNAEEHGIEPITKRTSSRITVPPRGWVRLKCEQKGTWNTHGSSGDIALSEDVATLMRVHDERYNDWTDPPMEHLQKELKDQLPFTVAELGIKYLDCMLLEAKAL